jgi:hypothetical protein
MADQVFSGRDGTFLTDTVEKVEISECPVFSPGRQPSENPHWICHHALSADSTSREREPRYSVGQKLLPSLYGPENF